MDSIFQKGPPWPLFPESSLPRLVHLGTRPLSPRPSLQGHAPSVGVRAPWGQGPHPLSSLRVGWGEDTWEVCSEKRVVLAGLWDEDIFISSLYFIHKPIPVFITYYLYNLVKKTNNKKGTQKMHFWCELLSGEADSERRCLEGSPVPDWGAAAVLLPPVPIQSMWLWVPSESIRG